MRPKPHDDDGASPVSQLGFAIRLGSHLDKEHFNGVCGHLF